MITAVGHIANVEVVSVNFDFARLFYIYVDRSIIKWNRELASSSLAIARNSIPVRIIRLSGEDPLVNYRSINDDVGTWVIFVRVAQID